MNEAINLLREALHIRMNGEHAPGGNENWADWDQKTEQFLRDHDEHNWVIMLSDNDFSDLVVVSSMAQQQCFRGRHGEASPEFREAFGRVEEIVVRERMRRASEEDRQR